MFNGNNYIYTDFETTELQSQFFLKSPYKKQSEGTKKIKTMDVNKKVCVCSYSRKAEFYPHKINNQLTRKTSLPKQNLKAICPH